MAKFEKIDARVSVAFLKCKHEKSYGRTFTGVSAARAIKEADGWRIDRADAIGQVWAPWEPITRDFYPTLTKAKEAIRKFARACASNPGTPERKEYGLSGRRRRR